MKDRVRKGSKHLQMSQRYDGDQGFSEQDEAEHMIIEQEQITSIQYLKNSRNKVKRCFQEPKVKLTFVSRQKNDYQQMGARIHNRQINNVSNRTHHQSLQMKKKQPNFSANLYGMVVKTKRTLIGENIVSKDFTTQKVRQLKQHLLKNGQQMIYEKRFQPNTHGYLRLLQQKTKHHPYSFAKSKYNILIRQKLRQSFIMSKPPKGNQSMDMEHQTVKFSSEFESSNLQFVTKVRDNQYDLYMSIDTNTKGHQNWFYFGISNLTSQNLTTRLNICNFKREFKMVNRTGRIYARDLQEDPQKWFLAGEKLAIQQNSSDPYNLRTYKLSFDFEMKPNGKYQLSLIPPFTYSQMLKSLQQMQEIAGVSVEVLTYSLAGLAIPLITVGNQPCIGKNVILVSGRIHPGQTVGSFMVKGLLQKLVINRTSDIQQLLSNTIIKIVPMINPDGVVFGNFRTSNHYLILDYLGNDLNRCFHIDDQVLFPEVYALKQLGFQLKQKFQNKFLMFIDLHGHSSKKNIFSYGPDFQPGSSNFYNSRVLPRILHMKSKYFKYGSCTFKLEDYKQNTARGFFLNQAKVLGYTIEASYGLYDSAQKQELSFKTEDWIAFGSELAEGFALTAKISIMSKAKTHSELKRIISQSQKEYLQIMKKLTKEIRKESSNLSVNHVEGETVDSDGQSQGQDLSVGQRVQINNKIIETSLPQFVLPKMIKPAILYPIITPRLFQANQQLEGHVRVLYTKRNKYSALRMMNISCTSNSLKEEIKKLDIFRPQRKNMKIERKTEF